MDPIKPNPRNSRQQRPDISRPVSPVSRDLRRPARPQQPIASSASSTKQPAPHTDPHPRATTSTQPPQAIRPTSSPRQPETSTEKTVHRKRKKLLSKKLSFAGSLILTVGVGLAIAFSFYKQNANQTGIDTPSSPTFSTIIPEGTTIDKLGGWQRVSPPGKDDNVFAYVDTIDDVSITVSQQPLPETFKNGTESKVADLAKQFNATNKLDTGTAIIYIGTSTKGPQSVIFTKDNLLVLIKSQDKISNKAWQRYIAKLQLHE